MKTGNEYTQYEWDTPNIIEDIFEELEKYETKYGLAIPIGAYLKIKEKYTE